LHAKLASKGARSKQLVRNNADLAGISSKAKAMSSQMDMKAARDVFKSSMVESETVMEVASDGALIVSRVTFTSYKNCELSISVSFDSPDKQKYQLL
jgi:hypothetical protein